MDEATAQHLMALNRAFYQTVAAGFDRTRQTAWPGWRRMLAHVPRNRPLRVLDAGCGNARLARFLTQSGVAIAYTGVDASPRLLDAARDVLLTAHEAEFRLIEANFLSEPDALPTGPFDLVALFGVLHHVPGAERRERLIQALAERVVPGGVLGFTAWRFQSQPRFLDHQVQPPTDLALDPGDVLLDWRAEGVHAVRYCHALNEEELTILVRESGLALLDAYRADGQSGDLNDYRLLIRPLAD